MCTQGPFIPTKFKKDICIGKGGFGVVHKAEWDGLQVAVKALHIEAKERARKQFESEGKILEELSHRNIVQARDASASVLQSSHVLHLYVCSI